MLASSVLDVLRATPPASKTIAGDIIHELKWLINLIAVAKDQPQVVSTEHADIFPAIESILKQLNSVQLKQLDAFPGPILNQPLPRELPLTVAAERNSKSYYVISSNHLTGILHELDQQIANLTATPSTAQRVALQTTLQKLYNLCQ